MRSITLDVVTVSLCLVLSGCAAGPVTSDSASSDLIAIGASSVEHRGCPVCHDPGDGTLSGQTTPRPKTMTYGTNLTPDPDSGLGAWTDEQIIRALRYGLSYQRRTLCASMPRYSDMGNREAASEVAYLRSIPPVSRDIPLSQCVPGMPPNGNPPDAGTDAAAMTPVDSPDLAVAIDASLSIDFGVPMDNAMDAIAMPADMSQPARPTGCSVKINEVQTGGMAGSKDQFIELYNPCAMAIDLSGDRLVYRSSAGVKDITEVAFDNIMVAPQAFLVCGQTNFSGKSDITYKGQLGASGGGLALKDQAGETLDSTGWGDAHNAFVVGAAALAPPKGQSIGRIPDGKESGDSSRDFTISVTPTPGSPNH